MSTLCVTVWVATANRQRLDLINLSVWTHETTDYAPWANVPKTSAHEKKKTSSYAFHKADVQLIKALLEVFALLSGRVSPDAQAELAQLVEQRIRNA